MDIRQIRQILTKKIGIREKILIKKLEMLEKARHTYHELLIKQPEDQEKDFPQREKLTQQQAQQIAQIISIFQKEQQPTKTQQKTGKNSQQENLDEFIRKIQTEINTETKKEIMRYYQKMGEIIERIELEIYQIEQQKRKIRMTAKERIKAAYLKAVSKIRKIRRKLRI